MKTKLSFQKLLSALLALVMILSTLVVLPMTVGAADALPDSTPWDGSTKTQPEGEGTKDSPWKIASGANIAWISFNALAKISNRATTEVPVLYMELVANVDLNDKAIDPIMLRRQTLSKNDNGTPDDPSDDTPIFNYAAVVFEGNGGTIKGLNTLSAGSAGLFSYIGNGSSFSNLNMVGANVMSNAASAANAGGTGAIVGEVAGYVNLYNCHVDATSTVKGIKGVGGLVGYINPGLVTDEKGEPVYAAPDGVATIRYCTNRATVTGDYVDDSINIGGIIGRFKTNCDVTIEYCANWGSLVGNKKNQAQVIMGGITGNLSQVTYPASGDYAAGDTATYRYLVNYGSIVVNLTADGKSTSYNWMGGITGHFNLGAPAGDETKTYHTIIAEYCFDLGAKNLTKADAVTQAPTWSAGYLSGNCADWQQDKTFSYIYGVPNANTPKDFVKYITINGTKAPAKTTDCMEVATDTTTIMMNMTTTTVKAETDKIVAAIDALGVAEMGGEPVDDGKERNFSWYTADGGTKEAPYEIANAAAWAGLVDLSYGRNTEKSGQSEAVSFDGKYFKLTGDIDLTGYILYPVDGENEIHLDGGNHTISNATLYSSSMGLFNILGRGSEIKNLKFSNMTYNASGTAGLLAANARADLSLYNIHADATCSVTTTNAMAGGLIGSITDMGEVTEEEILNVQFCTNEAAVTGREQAAGLIGYLRGSFGYNFDFCVNKGALTASGTGTTNNYIGGLFAAFVRNTQPSYGYISNCYNTGKLTAMNTTGTLLMGGMFGDLRAVEGSDVTIQNCHDYSARSIANPTAKSNGALAGYADNVQLVKMVYYCYGMNAADSTNMYAAVGTWTVSVTLDVQDCAVVESLTEEILSYTGETSTMQAEMAAIDAGIAELKLNEISFVGESEEEEPTPGEPQPGEPQPGEPQPGTPEPEQPKPEDNKTDDTTAAPSGGCGSSVTATFAVVAMTALCGMAIVGKKKED